MNKELLVNNKKTINDFDDFIFRIKEEVTSLCDENDIVSINTIIKNNGVELTGISIHDKDSCIAPNIYLNNYYEQYIEGKTIDDIVQSIIETAKSDVPNEFHDIENNCMSFDIIKNRVIYRLINYKKNKKLLKQVPHIRLLDLAVTFSYVVNTSDTGIASIRITNEHLDMWNVDLNILREYAALNTPRLMPAKIRNMRDIIKDIMVTSPEMLFDFDYPEYFCEALDEYSFDSKDIASGDFDSMLDDVLTGSKNEMYVLSNLTGINGSSVILYNGILKSFAKKLNSDLYILPSSVHEVIVIACDESMNPDELKDMVTEINRTQVSEIDQLSDNVYRYSKEKDSIIL